MATERNERKLVAGNFHYMVAQAIDELAQTGGTVIKEEIAVIQKSPGKVSDASALNLRRELMRVLHLPKEGVRGAVSMSAGELGEALEAYRRKFRH